MFFNNTIKFKSNKKKEQLLQAVATKKVSEVKALLQHNGYYFYNIPTWRTNLSQPKWINNSIAETYKMIQRKSLPLEIKDLLPLISSITGKDKQSKCIKELLKYEYNYIAKKLKGREATVLKLYLGSGLGIYISSGIASATLFILAPFLAIPPAIAFLGGLIALLAIALTTYCLLNANYKKKVLTKFVSESHNKEMEHIVKKYKPLELSEAPENDACTESSLIAASI